MRIAVCVKWVDTRAEVDALTGEVTHDARSYGVSPADEAAVELALVLAERWGDVVLDLVSVAPADADAVLQDLAATGPWEVHRVELGGSASDGDDGPDAAAVAAALADRLSDADLVLCGDHSLDRGSGAVPAFVAARLGAAQALGLVAVDPGAPGELVASRRLGAGRTERVRVRVPAVVSLEGSVANLRRASLAAVMRPAFVQVHHAAGDRDLPPAPRVGHRGPVRPRARVVAAPAGHDALARITELTGALVDRTPPRTVEATPAEAAALILEQVRAWDDE